MKKLFFLICLLGFAGFAFAQHNFGAFSDPFLSIQLAPSPVVDYVLKTDGTDNSWVEVNTLFDLSGFTSDDLTEGAVNLYDQIVTLNEGDNITVAGTYPDFTISASGSSGVTDHADLTSLNWADSGHTFDTFLNLNTNYILMGSGGEGSASPDAPAKNYVSLFVYNTSTLAYVDASSTLHIISGSDSGGGSAVSSVFGRVGNIVAATNDYTWAQIDKTTSDIADLTTKSHTSLTDIGTTSHDDIDTHIGSTLNPHSVTAAQVSAVDLSSDEEIGGLKTFTNFPLIVGIDAPTSSRQLVTKDYVDSFSQGLEIKESCNAASTGNLTLSGTQTVDDVVLVAGNRILVKNQTTGTENGIYVVASGAWSRATDYDEDSEVQEGTFTNILGGTENGQKLFAQITIDPVLDTSDLVFTELSAALAYEASNGIFKSANTFYLGAPLTQDTTFLQGNYNWTQSLSGTGDFRIQKSGSDILKVNGTIGAGESKVMVSTDDGSYVPLAVRANASQTEDLQVWESSSGTEYAAIDNAGFMDMIQTVDQTATSLDVRQTPSTLKSYTSGTNDISQATKYVAFKLDLSGESGTTYIRSIALRPKVDVAASNPTAYDMIYIYSDNGGEPGTSLAAGSQYRYGIITTSYTTRYWNITYDAAPAVYWVVMNWSAAPTGSTLTFQGNSAITDEWFTSADGATWSDTDEGRPRYYIYGRTGYAVYGRSDSNTGVYGYSRNGYGLYGVSENGNGIYGSATMGYGGYFTSTYNTGVYGNSTYGTAIYGLTTSGTGLYGNSTTGIGNRGATQSGTAVYGTSVSGTAIYGSTDTGTGVYVYTNNATGNGRQELMRLRRQTSGTPASGIGSYIDWEIEDSSGSADVISRWNAILTDVTNGSETGNIYFEIRRSGSFGEVLRIGDYGELKVWDGSATVNEMDSRGDLYVEDELEVDGELYTPLARIGVLNATTTNADTICLAGDCQSSWPSGTSNWATSSTDYWETTQWRWATTSADYWLTEQSIAGGNPFNQWLDTTSSVQFFNVTTTGSLAVGAGNSNMLILDDGISDDASADAKASSTVLVFDSQIDLFTGADVKFVVQSKVFNADTYLSFSTESADNAFYNTIKDTFTVINPSTAKQGIGVGLGNNITDDMIYFGIWDSQGNSGTEYLKWDYTDNRFELSDDLYISDNLYVVSNATSSKSLAVLGDFTASSTSIILGNPNDNYMKIENYAIGEYTVPMISFNSPSFALPKRGAFKDSFGIFQESESDMPNIAFVPNDIFDGGVTGYLKYNTTTFEMVAQPNFSTDYDNYSEGDNVYNANSLNNIVAGFNNYFINAERNLVGGHNVQVTGHNNLVGGSGAIREIIQGDNNIFSGAENYLISNDYSVLSSSNNLVFGINNEHNQGSNNLLGGSTNRITGDANIVGGVINNASGTANLVFGTSNTSTNNYNVAIGNGMIMEGTHSMGFGLQSGGTVTKDNVFVIMGGQVGIATTTPWDGYELAVAGDGVFTGDLYTLGNATSSHFAASEICLANDCRTSWPEGTSGNWATSSEQYFWNNTSTWAGFESQFATYYNATTTLNGFTDNSTNWDTAYGWGDHSIVGYLTGNLFNQWLDSTSSVQFLGVTTTGNFIVASSTDSNGSLFVDSLTGNVGIGTTTPYHALDISGVSMKLNTDFLDSDVSIWFGNIGSGQDRIFFDNWDADYFNDNGQTFVSSDDWWIDGRLHAATSTFAIGSGIFDTDESFGWSIQSTNLNDPGNLGAAVNQLPYIKFENSSEGIINNNQGAINSGLIILEDLFGTGDSETDMPTLAFTSNDISNIVNGSIASMTFNTTTYQLLFTGASLYSFDNNMYVSGYATTTHNMNVGTSTSGGIRFVPGSITGSPTSSIEFY